MHGTDFVRFRTAFLATLVALVALALTFSSPGKGTRMDQIGPHAAFAQTQAPSLNLETFSGTSTSFSSFVCNQGHGGSATYTETGDAAGPYPGTFTENVSMSWATPPPGGPIPQAISFSASFTAQGTAMIAGVPQPFTITGNKSYSGNPTFVACEYPPDEPPRVPTFVAFNNLGLLYSAVITLTTTAQSLSDSGTAVLSGSTGNFQNVWLERFSRPLAVGGISLDPAALPPPETAGHSIDLLFAIAAASALTATGAVWYVRRRLG
jgi:hypothetical protein